MQLSLSNISVVLTSFNGVEYIEQQINSILLQNVLPSEIIICDDGSTDGTINVLNKFKQHDIIKLYSNKERLGIAENFKKAVSLANPNNYIAFCDQDDIWLPNKLDKSLKEIKVLEANNPTMPCLVYSNLIFVNKEGQTINMSFYDQMGLNKFEHCFETALFGSLLLGCTILINSKMRVHFLNMPSSKLFYHDAWLALIGFGIGKVQFIKEPLVKYRLHNNNASIQNYKARNRILNAFNHIAKSFLKTNYLFNEIALAKTFKNNYYDLLSPNQQSVLANFLSLDNKYYIQKKWAFEKAFKNKWIQRF